MEPYSRKDSSFALCGLNCCLCPRLHTDGPSRCPGCGGPDFSSKHPSCPAITCARKHGSVEYCFQCADYPCGRYAQPGGSDSFMSYRNVAANFSKAAKDLPRYLGELERKRRILVELLSSYNDGRSKAFYCLAVDLLPLPELTAMMDELRSRPETAGMDAKERCREARQILESRARALSIELTLRK